jgi:hypothetical protein
MEPREGESLNESLKKKKQPKEILGRDPQPDVLKRRETGLGGKKAGHNNGSISKRTRHIVS